MFPFLANCCLLVARIGNALYRPGQAEHQKVHTPLYPFMCLSASVMDIDGFLEAVENPLHRHRPHRAKHPPIRAEGQIWDNFGEKRKLTLTSQDAQGRWLFCLGPLIAWPSAPLGNGAASPSGLPCSLLESDIG